MIRVDDLHIMIQLNIARCHGTGAFFTEIQNGFVTVIQNDCQPLQVQQNFNDVFTNTLNSAVLMHDAVNFYLFNCATRH